MRETSRLDRKLHNYLRCAHPVTLSTLMRSFADWHNKLNTHMLVTQCYLTMSDIHFIRVVYSSASFTIDWMVIFIFRPPLLRIAYVRLFWSAVLS